MEQREATQATGAHSRQHMKATGVERQLRCNNCQQMRGVLTTLMGHTKNHTLRSRLAKWWASRAGDLDEYKVSVSGQDLKCQQTGAQKTWAPDSHSCCPGSPQLASHYQSASGTCRRLTCCQGSTGKAGEQTQPTPYTTSFTS